MGQDLHGADLPHPVEQVFEDHFPAGVVDHFNFGSHQVNMRGKQVQVRCFRLVNGHRSVGLVDEAVVEAEFDGVLENAHARR